MNKRGTILISLIVLLFTVACIFGTVVITNSTAPSATEKPLAVTMPASTPYPTQAPSTQSPATLDIKSVLLANGFSYDSSLDGCNGTCGAYSNPNLRILAVVYTNGDTTFLIPTQPADLVKDRISVIFQKLYGPDIAGYVITNLPASKYAVESNTIEGFDIYMEYTPTNTGQASMIEIEIVPRGRAEG
jgi:hypothetical protein